jgi:hypothetical protein
VSDLVTDLDWWAATRYPNPDDDWAPSAGRHAYHEDAELTPIFHALSRGGWRGRQHEPAAPPAARGPVRDELIAFIRAARESLDDPADQIDELRHEPLRTLIAPPEQRSSPPDYTPRRRRHARSEGRHHRPESSTPYW